MSSKAAAGVIISKIIHHHFKNNRFQPFQQSSHFPDLDEPEYFVQVVQHFLNQGVFSKARKIAARKKRAARWLLLN